MRILKSEFVKSVANNKNMIIDDFPQIAFVGRSNVGKSSLLNNLTGRNKLARTSNTPGRTRLINYFLINGDTYFVDLPGYGFARASKVEVNSWQSLITPFLVNNPKLKCVCVLVDIRHEPTKQDKDMIAFLNYYRLPYIIIATKADKLGKSQIKPSAYKIANAIGVGHHDVYPVSNESGYGKENILDKLEQFILEDNSTIE